MRSLLIGAMLPTVLADLLVMPELWAGTLIALFAGRLRHGRPRLGVACGLLALFFRELALPYGLLSAALAWHGRRRRGSAWLIGLAAWLAFFGLHWWRVRGLIPPEAIGHRHGWICCGGAAFVISTAKMNAYLLCLPQWATAVYLVAALVGFAGWNTPSGTRMGLTLACFSAPSPWWAKASTRYWGAMIAPLLCFGVAQCRGRWANCGSRQPRRPHKVRRRSARCEAQTDFDGQSVGYASAYQHEPTATESVILGLGFVSRIGVHGEGRIAYKGGSSSGGGQA